jgi:hypothetical protein
MCLPFQELHVNFNISPNFIRKQRKPRRTPHTYTYLHTCVYINEHAPYEDALTHMHSHAQVTHINFFLRKRRKPRRTPTSFAAPQLSMVCMYVCVCLCLCAYACICTYVCVSICVMWKVLIVIFVIVIVEV